MADPRINVILGAKDEASRVVKGLRGQFERFKSDAKLGFGLGAGMSIFNMGTRAIGAVVDVMGDAVRMAAEEEAAIAQLTQAIKENDAAWDGNIDAVEALITKRQDLAYSDGEQRESLQLLVGATNDVTEAQKLLGTAMDFARFRNIDLKTSADLLGRAYAGNFGTLSRYGVVLEKGATATEALAQIQKMARGQAAAYANTTQGKLTRAQIALDDAMEELGKTLTPIVADMAQLAAETIPDLVQAVKDGLGPLAEFVDLLDRIPVDVLVDLQKEGQDLQKQLGDLFGRDIVNDFANFARIVGTGGAVLAYDTLPMLADALKTVTGESEKAAEGGYLLGNRHRSLSDAFYATGTAAKAAAAGIAELTDEQIAAIEAVSGGEVFKGSRDGKKKYRAEMDGARDLNKRIKGLRRDETSWEKKLMAAYKAKNKTAQATAQTELKRVRTQLRQSQQARKAIETETKRMLGLKDATQKATTKLQNLQETAKTGINLKVLVDDTELDRVEARIIALGGTPRPRNTPGPFTQGGPHHGGAVSAGRSYLIGQPGHQEWFTPRGPGTMTPARFGGGGGVYLIDGARLFDITDRGLGRRYSTSAAGGYYRSS